jgi:hypothetical protein
MILKLCEGRQFVQLVTLASFTMQGSQMKYHILPLPILVQWYLDIKGDPVIWLVSSVNYARSEIKSGLDSFTL